MVLSDVADGCRRLSHGMFLQAISLPSDRLAQQLGI